MPNFLERHSIAGVAGFDYYAIGCGTPPLVAINAIGQGTAIWLPLLERLSAKRRVIVWEMRQTGSNGDAITFSQHCDDLHAVLQQEGGGACHLLGWCTGAKLAARYARTHPGAVASMVFLSGSFKHPGRPAEFDTAYERDLEIMLRAIARQPSFAERLRLVFTSSTFGRADTAQLSEDEQALRAATGPSPHLEREIRRPFRDAPTLTAYARQHVEFWSHDETAPAPQLNPPVLGIAGGQDRIVSPAGLRDALTHFSRAHYAQIAGASHYCLYECPGLVAGLIESFLAIPISGRSRGDRRL
jgi:pimeloyl-ACP methyl ester carboxylesterase